VRANKRRAARDAIEQFIAENKEEHHA